MVHNKNDDKMQKLIDMNLEGKIGSKIFEKKMSIMKTEQETTIESKRKVKKSLESDQSISMRLENFKQDINMTNLMDEFVILLLEAIIENVVGGVADAKTYSYTTYKDNKVCSYSTRMPCGVRGANIKKMTILF